MATAKERGAAWRRVRGFLRRPALVVGEVLALGMASVLVAALPQEPDALGVAHFGRQWPLLGRLGAVLGLHSVVTSGWFLALVALAIASLTTVQVDQWRRARRAWSAPPGRAAMARAPFRRERDLAPGERSPERFVRTGRLGVLGSPVFHLGLLVVVLAGLVRLLFFSDAMTEVVEGATVAAGPDAFEARRAGRLAKPFELPVPLRLDEVKETRYASGVLEQLEAKVSLLGEAGAEPRTLAINSPLDFPGLRRLYLTPDHGLAAMCSRIGPSGERQELVKLEPDGDRLRGRFHTDDGREVRLRASVVGGRPDAVEVRVLRSGALLSVGERARGDAVPIGEGEVLRLLGFTAWAKLRGSQDVSRPIFFVGLSLALGGAVLMFSVVTVDSAVFAEDGRLVVALRPQRFAPLFADRFEHLCKEWRT